MYTPVNSSFTIFKWVLRGSKLYSVFVMCVCGGSDVFCVFFFFFFLFFFFFFFFFFFYYYSLCGFVATRCGAFVCVFCPVRCPVAIMKTCLFK